MSEGLFKKWRERRRARRNEAKEWESFLDYKARGWSKDFEEMHEMAQRSLKLIEEWEKENQDVKDQPG